MGNKATKVSDEAHKAADTVRKRLTIRRRRPENVSEFSAEDIRKKFESIPKLTAEEKSVLQASWANVNKKIEIAGAQTFIRMFESNPETQNQFRKFQGMDLVQLEQSAEMAQHGKRVLSIVGMAVDNLDNYQIVWDNLIKVGREHFTFGALPMYFDLMGPHFVIAIRSTIGNDWYEALEYHWLAFFEVILYIMKFGWHLQRADVQRKARRSEQS